MVGREPCSQGLAGRLPEAAQLRAAPRHVRGFVEQDEVEREVVQIVAATVQVGRSTLDRLVRDRLLAYRGDKRFDRAFQEVLIDTTMFVQQSQRGFEAVR